MLNTECKRGPLCRTGGLAGFPVASHGRYTLLFESFELSWLKISTVDAVRKQLKLSWNAVDNIMQRAVKRGLTRRRLPLSARHLCVDEVSFKKGYQYVTVISDTQGQALELRDDRGVESLAGYLRTLGDRQIESIKTLSMDMNPALYQRGPDPLTLRSRKNRLRSLPCSQNALCRGG